MESKETVRADGARFWLNAAGKYHREDGPARVFPGGAQEWWRNGLRHHDDGPAEVKPDGRQERYRNDERILNPDDVTKAQVAMNQSLREQYDPLMDW